MIFPCEEDDPVRPHFEEERSFGTQSWSARRRRRLVNLVFSVILELLLDQRSSGIT